MISARGPMPSRREKRRFESGVHGKTKGKWRGIEENLLERGTQPAFGTLLLVREGKEFHKTFDFSHPSPYKEKGRG